MIKYILFHPDNRSRLIDTEEILNNTSLSYYDKLEKTKYINKYRRSIYYI